MNIITNVVNVIIRVTVFRHLKSLYDEELMKIDTIRQRLPLYHSSVSGKDQRL